MLVELKAVLKELQKKRLELQIKGLKLRCGLATVVEVLEEREKLVAVR